MRWYQKHAGSDAKQLIKFKFAIYNFGFVGFDG